MPLPLDDDEVRVTDLVGGEEPDGERADETLLDPLGRRGRAVGELAAEFAAREEEEEVELARESGLDGELEIESGATAGVVGSGLDGGEGGLALGSRPCVRSIFSRLCLARRSCASCV